MAQVDCINPRPNPQELWDSLAARFSRIVLGGADIIPESNEWYALSLNYAMAEEFYAYSDQLRRESDPRTACCNNLIRMAARVGLYPRPAVAAEGYVRLRGKPYTRLPPDMEIRIGKNTYYAVGAVPAEINGFGLATVRFRAVEPGEGGNTAIGTVTLVNAPAGVKAELYSTSFCNGSEEESCEAFRARYLNRLTYRPRATAAWLMEKLLEWPCVTRVCPRKGTCCEEEFANECACVDCNGNAGNEYYVMFDNTFECGAAPECVLREVEEWMFGEYGMQGRGMGEAPIGVCGRIRMFVPARFDMHIDTHDCLSPDQMQAVEQALRDYMSTTCPSEVLSIKTLTVVIGQVLGPGLDFDITFEVDKEILDSRQLDLDICGDIIPDCDVLPCLRNIRFTGPTQESFLCF